MNGTKNLVSALLIAALFALPFASVYTVAQVQKVPTKKELKVLLKSAKEPQEHLRIAAYYPQEAAHKRAEAKEHSDLAAIYEKDKPFAAMEAKYGKAFGQGADHCKTFATLAADQAKEADVLAAVHEEMAKAGELKGQ